MKRQLHNSLRALFLSLAVLLSLPMLAVEVEIDGIRYDLNAETKQAAVIAKSSGKYSGEVVIPESVEHEGATYSVTGIGADAFYYCSGLTSVTIPNSVESIGSEAFDNCTSLSSVAFPSTLHSIGSEAFMECHALAEATSNSVNIVIGDYCFANIPYDAVLHVVPGTKARYIATGWDQYFGTIVEDVESDVEVSNKYIKIGTAQASMTPGTWYFVHNSRIPNNTAVDFSDPGEEVKVAGGFVQDCGIGKDVLMSKTALIDSVKGNGLHEYDCNSLLIRFVPVEGVHDAFKVQFATGNWLKLLSYDFTTTDLESEATYFNFYLIDGNERGRFGWNAYDMEGRVDNNGAGQTLVPWSSGEVTGVMTGNNVWQIYDAVVLEDEFSEDVCIEDGSVDTYYKASDQQCTTLQYRRTLPNMEWNCLYVPFKIPYSVLSDNYDVAYINGMNSYDNDDNGQIDDIRMEVIKVKQGTLKANHPYLVKARSRAAMEMDIVQEDVTLHASKITTLDCSSVYARYEITGTYSTMMPEELEESLVITTSGCWQKISETSALKPFRFYLTISSREGSPLEVENDALSRIRISVRGEDDNATGIQDVFSDVQEQAPVFDLSGRRVHKPAKGGMYISNGRKLIY